MTSFAELKEHYIVRRLGLLLGIAILLALAVIAMMLLLPTPITQKDILGKPPAPYKPPTIQPAPVEIPSQTGPPGCVKAPIESLGCFAEYTSGENNPFGLYGLSQEDKNVKRAVKNAREKCTGRENFIDCVIDNAVYESEDSWVCKWKCLEDANSCEIYKMHLAVAVARNFAGPWDIFVAQTEDFGFYVLANIDGKWMSKFKYGNKPTVSLYNDKYYAGRPMEISWPEVKEVGPGDKFCFDVVTNRSCVCKIEMRTFKVADCPQMPADMRGICDRPVTKVFLDPGVNKVCFNVLKNATDNLYTYDFVLTSGTYWLPAGNAFVKKQEYDCCVDSLSFKGFLSVSD